MNQSEEVKSGRARAALIAPETFAPGSEMVVAVKLDPEKDWHTYWINPGDSGMTTTVEWTLPDGLSAGPLEYPVPHRFVSSGLVGYGYSEPVYLRSKIRVPADFSATQIEIKATVAWLTCNDGGCVPGDAILHVQIPLGQKPDAGGALAGVNEMVYPVDQSAELSAAKAAEKDGFLVLTAEVSPKLRKMLEGELKVFFESGSVVDHAEPVEVKLEGNQFSIRAEASEFLNVMPDLVAVLVVPEARENSLRLVFHGR